MENNENNPIVDYKKIASKRVIVLIIKILIILYVFNSIISLKKEFNEELRIAQNEIEIAKIVEENNKKVVLMYDYEDEYFNIKDIKEIEYDNGIKIPTLRKYKDIDYISSCYTYVETNIIANGSPVLNMNYKNDLYVDMFKTELVKQDGYRRILHAKIKDDVVYVREEKDGYFSYIIIDGCNVTYGISYGDPETNIEINNV